MSDELTRQERIEELVKEGMKEEPTSSISVSTDLDNPEEPVEETDSGGKKVRIPASRLKTLTAKISELEERLKQDSSYAERVAALEAQLKGTQETVPEWWVEAWGDSDASKKAYRDQQRIMREEMRSLREEEERQRQLADSAREQEIQEIEQSFDDQMDSLEEDLGRELTLTQKSELLEIVGEYSPMDGDKYLAYLPVSKAYDIWSKTHTVDQSKNEIAKIAGIQSQGSSSTPSNERPSWQDWRKRIPS